MPTMLPRCSTPALPAQAPAEALPAHRGASANPRSTVGDAPVRPADRAAAQTMHDPDGTAEPRRPGPQRSPSRIAALFTCRRLPARAQGPADPGGHMLIARAGPAAP